MHYKTYSNLVFLLFLTTGLIYAQQETHNNRFALVIGNSSYIALGQLKNPRNDATDIANSLKTLAFDTEILLDANLETMEESLLQFGSKLDKSPESIGFFYYAGHGVQSEGTNYLIPTDANITSETFLKTKSLPLSAILDTIKISKSAHTIIVLDACRDNPFAWNRSSTRGLTIERSPQGCIVVYSTSAGSVALDGSGRNSIFTSELIKQLAVPGLEIQEIFQKTGAGVQNKSNGEQTPAIYNQLFSPIYLSSPNKEQIISDNIKKENYSIISFFEDQEFPDFFEYEISRWKDGPYQKIGESASNRISIVSGINWIRATNSKGIIKKFFFEFKQNNQYSISAFFPQSLKALYTNATKIPGHLTYSEIPTIKQKSNHPQLTATLIGALGGFIIGLIEKDYIASTGMAGGVVGNAAFCGFLGSAPGFLIDIGIWQTNSILADIANKENREKWLISNREIDNYNNRLMESANQEILKYDAQIMEINKQRETIDIKLENDNTVYKTKWYE